MYAFHSFDDPWNSNIGYFHMANFKRKFKLLCAKLNLKYSKVRMAKVVVALSGQVRTVSCATTFNKVQIRLFLMWEGLVLLYHWNFLFNIMYG